MKKQQGAALIVVLSLLAVSLMIGLTSIQSSQVDERLAGNYKAAAEAQMGAEMAASEGVAFLFSKNSNSAADRWSSLSKDLSEFSVPSVEDLGWSSFESSGEDGGCSSPVACYYLFVEDGGSDYIVSMGAVGFSVSEAVVVKVGLGSLGPTGVESLFRNFGMLAGGDININGSSVFDGSVHANGELTVRGGYVQRDEGATMTSSAEDDVPEVEIPEVDFSFYLDNYSVISLDVLEGRGNSPDYCEFDRAGNLSGAVFYCSADMVISSSSPFSNAIILSEGGVEQNGGVSQGEDGIETAVLAKGDIVFNGSSVVHGWFFSGGDIVQNGSSVLNGSIVAHGEIRKNGSMVFNHNGESSMGSVVLGSGEGGSNGPSDVSFWR